MTRNVPSAPELPPSPQELSSYCPVRTLTGSDRLGYRVEHCALRPDHQPEGHRLIAEHRLVWQGVHGVLPSRCIIRHKDGDPLHNRLHNLELVTSKEHYRDLHAAPPQRKRRGWRLIGGRWHKRCTSCGEWRPAESSFTRKRGICKECYRQRERTRSAGAYRQVKTRVPALGVLGSLATSRQRQMALLLLLDLRHAELVEEEDGDLLRVIDRWALLLPSP